MGRLLGGWMKKGNFLTEHPDLLQTLRIYYIILQVMSQLCKPIKMCQISETCQICQSAVNLSCQSDVKKMTKVQNMSNLSISVKKLWNMTGPSVNVSARCQICQNWQDSKKNVHLTCALMPWSVKSDTCLIRLTFFGGFWQSAHPGLLFHWRETNPFFLSPPLLSCSCSGVSAKKIPSFSIFAKGPDPRAKGVCRGDYP